MVLKHGSGLSVACSWVLYALQFSLWVVWLAGIGKDTCEQEVACSVHC